MQEVCEEKGDVFILTRVMCGHTSPVFALLLILGLKISYRVKWAQVTISDVNIIRVLSEAEMCCHSPSAAPHHNPPISWPCPPRYYRAKCCNTNIASWNVSDSGWVVRPSVFDLSSLPVDALTGGAPDRHGNKGPLLLLVKGLNCCQDLMIRSSIQGRRYYELFVSSFFNFFPLTCLGF